MSKTSWNPNPGAVAEAPKRSEDKVEIYVDEGGEFRWRRVAVNGQIVRVPGEGFSRKYTAIRAAVAQNPDVWADRVMDATSRPIRRCRSVLVTDNLPKRMP